MIAIAGGKGGCGKTTTTLATARALQAAGIGARAVDLDSGMPNLHRMANVERDPSLVEIVDDPAVEIQRDPTGTQIVPAPRALGDLDVPAALDAIRPGSGVALLDCPAGAGPSATAPLREADAAILVTTGRSESVEDAAKTGRMAGNLGVPVLGAVVTRTQRVSRGVEAELAVERVRGVPHSGDPLGDDRVRECYNDVAGWIEAWLRKQRAREGPATYGESAVGAERTRGACPNCGGARSTQKTSRRESIRRRGRRSPRSPGPADTRSSSRGGGAPSGRR